MHEHTQPRRISKAQRAAHAARVADARRVCDELIADLKGQPAIEVLARNQRLSIAFGWCVQAHRYAEAALVLIDAGMEHESQVLQRQLLEFTLYLKWLRSRGDAATEAVLVEHKRTIGNLASDAMGGPLELPQDYLDFVDGMDVSPVDEDDRFQKVQSLCREMGYINDLYALYRWLSGIAHPSLAAAAPYLVDDANGKPAVVWNPHSYDGDSVLVIGTLLVWAGRELDEMVLHKPRKKALQAAAKRLGIERVLK